MKEYRVSAGIERWPLGEILLLSLPEWLVAAITTTRGTSLVLEALDQTYTRCLL